MQNSARRRADTSILSSDMAMILMVSLFFFWIIITYMNTSKEISAVEDAISATKKTNAEITNLIENQNRIKETLKFEKIINYAKSRKMTTPNPGQVCVITDEDWQSVPPLTNRQQKHNVESFTAFQNSKKANDSL